MNRFREATLTRACHVVQIPSGQPATLDEGETVVVMQTLADAFVVQAPALGGLFRVDGTDADALGLARPQAARERVAALVAAGEPLTPDVLREALRDVYDPELPVSIVDLGLVYDLTVAPADDGEGVRARVTMTLTAPGCGMGAYIANEVRARLESLPGVTAAEVELVWDPPWTPARIDPAARARLGLA